MKLNNKITRTLLQEIILTYKILIAFLLIVGFIFSPIILALIFDNEIWVILSLITVPVAVSIISFKMKK